MAPSHSRHLLVWTTLPIAILLSYLWFKRKRLEVISDPGELKSVVNQGQKEETSPIQELKEPEENSRDKIIKRSLSGVESSPIDIVFPPDLKPSNSSQRIISDEDLDLEIEKIKSMKNTSKSSVERFNKKKETPKVNSPIQSKIIESAKKDSSPKVFLTPSPKKTEPVVKVEELEVKEEKVPLQKKSPVKVSPKNKKSKMVEKEVVTSNLEKKMNSLKLESNTNRQSKISTPATTVTEQEIFRQSNERDSANHSPADVMLASPSLSCISDSHSEGSSDSGKGCSEVATPPSRTPAGDGSVSSDSTLPTIYQFVIPQALVGRLIGRYGAFVTQIKNKTHAHIVIKKHPEDNQMKICAIEGTQVEIENALEMIRDKFPEKKYPELTLEQVIFTPPIPTLSLLPEQLCLKLVEAVNNDTIVSCMVAPNHLFLQQPTHPSFPNLNMLSSCMNLCYADANSPMLPDPLPENPVCAAYSLGAWYRAIVLSTDNESETSYVKFLDYGGYANVKNSDLRQIRADFLMLPFQAAECFLANIRPIGGDDAEWAEEAFNLVADLTRGAIMYTQVAEYTDEGIPLVLIYVAVSPQQVIFLNGELVNRGFAEWISAEDYVAYPADVEV
ncbi:hypothetical protein RN001_011664 [Aquatica leii]|uniref:Tudor domain-containing protein n=1 Tax=Aquatica leii TaxID=1421715 RepID=A0AAN7PT82_9COLE|nr:hypothetical protein RN001_011664 [Aquatica leii]